MVSFFTSSEELEQWAISHGELYHPIVQRRLFELRCEERYQTDACIIQDSSCSGSGDNHPVQSVFEIPDLTPWTPVPVPTNLSPCVDYNQANRSLHTPILTMQGSPYTQDGQYCSNSSFDTFNPPSMCWSPVYQVGDTPTSEMGSLHTPNPQWIGSPLSQPRDPPSISFFDTSYLDNIPDMSPWTPTPLFTLSPEKRHH